MRVVAGERKGHTLRAPKGMETRPTSDKVREAVFSILAGEFEGTDVLDLYAGTGALAIEALSRGAARAVLVEKRRDACQVIRQNLKHTRFEEQARLLCMPVERALPALEGEFSLVFLDPPYAMDGLHDIMELVGSARVVADQALVVFEHSPRFAVRERYARLVLQRRKVYGDTAVSIFVAQSGGEE